MAESHYPGSFGSHRIDYNYDHIPDSFHLDMSLKSHYSCDILH